MVRAAHGKKTLRSESRGLKSLRALGPAGLPVAEVHLASSVSHTLPALPHPCCVRKHPCCHPEDPWTECLFLKRDDVESEPSSAPRVRIRSQLPPPQPLHVAMALARPLLAWRAGGFLAESLRSPCRNQRSFPADTYTEPKEPTSESNMVVKHLFSFRLQAFISHREYFVLGIKKEC